VAALALDGKRLAWSDCSAIHVWQDGRDLRLRLPRAVASWPCGSGQLALGRRKIGWLFENDHGPLSSIALGVASPGSRTTRLLRAAPGYGEKFDAGVPGAVAADGKRVLWTWPQVTVAGPADAIYYCDHYSKQPPCTVTIRAASVHGWRRGVIPAASPIAADHGWLAAGIVKTGTFPQARAVGPRLVVVRRLKDGSRVTGVQARGLVEGLALSHRLLAVQRLGAIDLFALPSGRFIRTVDVHLMNNPRFPVSLAVHDTDLIFWGQGRIEKIDSQTGTRTVLVRAPSLTAVAVDGTRLAWATASGNGGVIRTRSLDSPARTQA
jgi:hypothetical protein